MIWFDVVAVLLFVLRGIVLGPTLPQLFDTQNDSSASLAEAEGREKRVSVASEDGDSLLLSKSSLARFGSLQLHIHVVPDLKSNP
jgi:hypothetical protein